MKIVFFGTPEFGVIALNKLANSEFKPVLAITEPDKPVGRKQIITPPPAKVLALKCGIPVKQPERIESCKSEIENLKPDLGIVAAYGQILPKNILEIPKYGFLNIHPSLLPKYRGPSPIQASILNGDSETGVSIMLLDEKTDHGKIVSSIKHSMSGDETYQTLHAKLAESGADLLIKTIPEWVRGSIKPLEQNEPEATYTNIIKKEHGHIDWLKNASYIERQTRALNPWPSTFSRFKYKNSIKTVKILKANVLEQTKDGPFGQPGKTFLGTNEKIAVQTGKDFLIIEELQLEGKKPMPVADFLRGHEDFVGTILC